MPESTIALIVSIVTATIAALGGWRLWLDSRTTRRVQVKDSTVKEWRALLEAYGSLQDQMEGRLAANDAEIKALRAKIEEMEQRHDRERKIWLKERGELEDRIAPLERENCDLRGELESLKAEAKSQQEARLAK